jgi:hypothetical protein
MSVSAPPRPPRPSDPVTHGEFDTLVEALIKEAKQRARRRRRRNAAIVTLVVVAGVALFGLIGRSAQSQTASPALSSQPVLSGGKVKVVIAGTNDLASPPTDGSLAGKGTFKASGAVADAGPALGYRKVSAAGTLITLRYVTKGNKGSIIYVVKIDTTAGTSKWTIVSGTKAYAGLHGKGTETENDSYTVSVLKGRVWS